MFIDTTHHHSLVRLYTPGDLNPTEVFFDLYLFDLQYTCVTVKTQIIVDMLNSAESIMNLKTSMYTAVVTSHIPEYFRYYFPNSGIFPILLPTFRHISGQ